VLVPSPLTFGAAPEAEGQAAALHAQLPLATIEHAATIRAWVAESPRTLRALLGRVQRLMPLACPLQEIAIEALPRPDKGRHDPVPPERWRALLAPAFAGLDLGLASEAGLPAVADPGAELVRAAHAEAIEVVPLPGPSAISLAVAASGLGGQSFAFVGYLPQERAARATRLRELEALSRRLAQVQVFIETPYRNAALWQTMLETLAPASWVAVAAGIGWPGAATGCREVAAWRQAPPPLRDDVPAVFSLLAPPGR
jgi:16S rRNA (cytidine1402-2'-O)-methyltransferase